MKQNIHWLQKACAALRWDLAGTKLGPGVACTAFALTAIYVWVLPIGHTTALRSLAFFSLAILTAWAVWKQGLRLRFPIAWAWGIYAAVALVSVLYALDPLYSLSEIKAEIGYGMLACVLGATWVRNEISLSRLVTVLLTGNAFLTTYAVFQATVLLRDTPPQTLGSLNSGFGTFSTYLITVFPFLVAYGIVNARSRPARGVLLALLAANLAALFYTISRAAVLAIIVEILVAGIALATYYLPRLSRRQTVAVATLGLAVLLGLSGLFGIQMAKRMPAYHQRNAADVVEKDPRVTVLWPAAIDNIRATPLSGGGFGRNAYKLRNPDVAKTSPLHWHAHNVFLNKGVQMGLPGILAFVLLLGALAWTIRPTSVLTRERAGTAVYMLAGLAMIAGVITKNLTDDYFVRDNALMFWLLAGALAGALRGSEKG